MLLLALDTATPAVTVAVHDGTRLLAAGSVVGARRHGELAAPLVRQVLAESGAGARDLTDIAVGVGPGPFTGLRVGLVTAYTMAAVTGAALVGCCSLDVVALGYLEQGGSSADFVVATDARRQEVHWAAYAGGGRRVDGPAVERPGELAVRLRPGVVAVGRGAALYDDVLPAVDGPLDPDAAVLARAVSAGKIALLDPEPLYLRRPDAAPPGRPKPVS